mmetsp:Transcript_25585/g.46179  ORF Transcript_25585/g.46179 Transcript_25585/m.46179 type:complete len:352 (-) Transcript_25585:113-1168(-)|eukprot:CAMPEP_0202495460 /NCGR_PEP_ID=MMETSP1361-20130828/16538_1 /ASSEMBLY_ACC=CAM_ASM_000849 /TAXON_ID=210615 /ORGANISM="Staurosira complex sp., Strain CCMP2646" /LENGTH=351 /DNA_ID=CAMNT_0049126485 /DNA_START=142 /DNA_END=1197 /DNA_ORIENTATION=-
MRQPIILPLLLVLLLGASNSFAFYSAALTTSRTSQRGRLLFAKKKKKSVLGEVAASGGVVPKTRNIKRTTSTKKSAGASVSPALAEWASTTADETNVQPAESVPTTTTVKEDVSANVYTPFEKEEKKKSTRRVKQSARKQDDAQRDAQVSAIIDNINTILEETKNSLDEILNAIRPILSQTSGNLRLLTAGKEYNYRLAWVGSDDALSHVGTGSHKVPLARMQEVFLTCQGKGRVEILEVISILGPFPNVRNTLQGDASKIKKIDDRATEWEIVMDSMIDGTGKEITAGSDDNIRRVKLHVHFADPTAILAVVPPESGSVREDPLEDNGSHALLFVREDDLEAKLDMMRVS